MVGQKSVVMKENMCSISRALTWWNPERKPPFWDKLNINKNAFQSKAYHPCNTWITRALSIDRKFISMHLTSILSYLDLDLQMTLFLLKYKHTEGNIIIFYWTLTLTNELDTQSGNFAAQYHISLPAILKKVSALRV